ncbi:MAG: DUF512 domain-containing protein [Candidatus Krumholzibacteriota bacterium]|nr:DUF512 domain-containing protein [Candidatus Krumholzibacteriota bacterium]
MSEERRLRSCRHPGLRVARGRGEPGLEILGVGEALAGRARAGERVLAVDGHALEDRLDYLYFTSFSERPRLRIRAVDGAEREETFSPGELAGDALAFAPLAFRTCGNDCVFCFIQQNPPGLRDELYLMDEDYRLGFLFGNYVTLALAKDRDLDRIVRLRLSPVYLSVHATDPALRNRLLGIKRSRDVLAVIDRLASGGVTLHAQVVLVPGWNDGAQLERTLDDLAARHPCLASVGVVPVGLTVHRGGLTPLAAYDAAGCARVIDQVAPRQERWLAVLGTRFAFLADEFYLQGRRPLPGLEHYEDLAQIDNGIGMARDFAALLAQEAAAWRPPRRTLRAALVTGRLGERLWREVLLPELASLPGLLTRLVALDNPLYGAPVTVSGLLPGRAILAALQGLAGEADVAVLPPNVLNAAGRFLDDLTLAELHEASPLPVLVPETGMLGVLSDFARHVKPESP